MGTTVGEKIPDGFHVGCTRYKTLWSHYLSFLTSDIERLLY